MENSSLNASHRYARQANRYFRSCKFDEAVKSHENAIAKINEACGVTTVPKAIESLRLQKDFHMKQIDMVLIRKEQYERNKLFQQTLAKGSTFRDNLESTRLVQMDMFRTMDSTEKLVEVLEQKSAQVISNKESAEFIAKLFEDLKLLQKQSGALVHRLITQLDDRIAENEDLRERLEVLEEGQREQVSGSKAGPSAKSHSLETGRLLSDSDPDLTRAEELAPLELPTFDFNTFSSEVDDSEGAGGRQEEATQAAAAQD